MYAIGIILAAAAIGTYFGLKPPRVPTGVSAIVAWLVLAAIVVAALIRGG